MRTIWKKLTIRSFASELFDFIRKMTTNEGLSLNQVAIKLLCKGAGIDSKNNSANCVNNSLNSFIGSLSSDESRQLEKSVSQLRVIDDEMWRSIFY